MSLAGTSITWRGLTLSGSRPADFLVTSFAGWDESPDARSGGDQRPNGHGRFDGPVYSDERVVTVGGRIYSQDRDGLLATLAAGMTISDDVVEPLTITHAGATLTADARLTRYRSDVAAGFAAGYVPFAVEWRCADPLRYGATQNLTTGFASLTGGLEFDLYTDGTTDTGYLEYGTPGSTGQVQVSNPGTAPAYDQFYVQGPTPPFDIVCVDTGQRLSFSRALSAGETLLIDSATGLVGLGASAVDYSGYLTRAEWFAVPRKGSATIAFVPQGPWDIGTLTVVHRPAWW